MKCFTPLRLYYPFPRSHRALVARFFRSSISVIVSLVPRRAEREEKNRQVENPNKKKSTQGEDVSRVPPWLRQDIAQPFPPLVWGRGIFAREIRFVHGFGEGLRGGAWPAADGGFVVGEDVFETDVGVGHAQVRVLGVEDLDEFGRRVAHCGDERGNCSVRLGGWVGVARRPRYIDLTYNGTSVRKKDCISGWLE